MSDSFGDLPKVLSDRYVIERELGQGGMATVYLAEDVKHRRKVAVKVLRPELSAVLGTERFQREIEIAASLNHPNILQLLDSGIAVEQPSACPPVRPSAFLYYVMPYIEGDTLRERLTREKELSVDDALTVTRQVAAALDYAHRRDVVHRDIKPENILFHEGQAMVADFGIALAVKSAGGDRLTETGMSLGTPAYMSPEQVAGDRDIDGRSDVYSLACVLYEMLAGDPPFVASNPQAILAKHVTDPAPPITTVRSSVPQPVANAIAKALGKARADRFESAKAFSEALFAEPTEAEPEVKSIVVLPFENLSPVPEQEYFSDGLTEEVISDLSMVGALQVISRSSAMTFKGSNKKIPEIANELNVRYVLEGSVRKAGNSLRITAQLIDASSDVHLWADKYTGTLENVFDFQEEVSLGIVEALKVRLTDAEEEKIAERPIENIAAYECHLKARAEVFKFTVESTLQALRLLQNAVDIIGDNALLYSTMGFAYWQLVNLGAEQEEYLAKAHESVDRALALSPDLPYAHAVRGWIGHLEGDMQQSAQHFKKALASEPADAFAIEGLICVYFLAGKTSAGIPLCEKLAQIDPLDFIANVVQVLAVFYAGEFDRVVPLAEKLFEMYPDVPYSMLALATGLMYSGDHKAALSTMDDSGRLDRDEAMCKVALVLKHAIEQEEEAAFGVMSPEFVKTSERDPTFAHYLAGAFSLLRETDEALKWTEAAINAGFINYPMLAQHDPFLENIRGERRYKDLMERVKKEWEEFEV